MQDAPPFGDCAIVTFLGQDERNVLAAAAKFRDSIRAALEQPDYAGERCGVLGPAPCPVPKINYNFRYQLTLRCAMTKKLRSLLAWLLGKLAADKEFRSVSAFVDVNGYDG